MTKEERAASGTAPSVAKRCFIITPIGAPGSPERKHADWVKEYVVRPVFEPRGYVVSRADEIPDPSMITDTIFELVTACEVCVADLSYLNVNVFYELGVRHAFQKPVIHLAAEGTRLPFDNSGHRTNFFDVGDVHSLNRLRSDIDEQLTQIESPGFKVSNPLTQARGRTALSNSADAPSQLIADMADRVARMERAITTLSSRASVADAIHGQGELATWNASDLARALPGITLHSDGSITAADGAQEYSVGAPIASNAATAAASTVAEAFSGSRRPRKALF